MTGPVVTAKQLAMLDALALHGGWVMPGKLISLDLMPEGTSIWGMYVTGAALFRKGLAQRRSWLGGTEFALTTAGFELLEITKGEPIMSLTVRQVELLSALRAANQVRRVPSHAAPGGYAEWHEPETLIRSRLLQQWTRRGVYIVGAELMRRNLVERRRRRVLGTRRDYTTEFTITALGLRALNAWVAAH